jgi:adenylate kinase family enzyme
VLRGNSGAGKSTVARMVRSRLTGCVAWVEQDYFRRVVLHEHDVPDGLNIGLISQTVRYALDHGCDVILEGILYAAHYSEMLRALRDDHRGRTTWYWFDVSLEETLRRHATRPQSKEFGADAMRNWYRERDPLQFATETLVPEEWTIDQTVDRILSDMQRGSSPRLFLERTRYIDAL